MPGRTFNFSKMSDKKRVLITGGAGFLGSHLCDRFLAEGYHVIAMDNLITGSLQNIEHLFKREDFEFHHHDVSKFVFVPGKLDYILHFASPASPIDYLKIPIQTLKVGSLGTHNLLGLARVKGARMLIASTSEVYGDPEVHPQVETYFGNVNPVGPRGCYDEAKRFQEAITMAYHTHHGLETRIIRIFNTYGPRMRLDDGRVLPAFLSQALRGENLTVFGDGSQTRSFCYVDDLVEGIYRLLLSDYALAGKHWQPLGNHHQGIWRRNCPPHRRRVQADLPGAARKRPPEAQTRHQPCQRSAGLGAKSGPCRRLAPHPGVFQGTRSITTF